MSALQERPTSATGREARRLNHATEGGPGKHLDVCTTPKWENGLFLHATHHPPGLRLQGVCSLTPALESAQGSAHVAEGIDVPRSHSPRRFSLHKALPSKLQVPDRHEAGSPVGPPLLQIECVCPQNPQETVFGGPPYERLLCHVTTQKDIGKPGGALLAL